MIVRLNYEDYDNLMKHYYTEYVKQPSLGWPQAERMVLNINRHLLNLLTTVRTFLDHSRTNLIRRYGRASKRLERFKDACSQAYNNNFSYRFLYSLRNYAQHCGMPIGQLTVHSKAMGPDAKDVSHFLAVKFNRDKLLRDFSWGSRLKKEIKQLPSMFGINPHITEMMDCLERINISLVVDDLPELIESAELIQQFVAETKELLGVPCLFGIRDIMRTQEGKVGEIGLDIEWIPFHIVDTIMNAKKIMEASRPKNQKTLLPDMHGPK
ncbi:hypothetical protein KAU88_00010 [Candidatus Bathyarchaeota archaeon]|nr:hypothetical protein [Candidatus Bathyarchaeota archaeon]